MSPKVRRWNVPQSLLESPADGVVAMLVLLRPWRSTALDLEI